MSTKPDPALLADALDRMRSQVYWLRHGTWITSVKTMAVHHMEAVLAHIDAEQARMEADCERAYDAAIRHYNGAVHWDESIPGARDEAMRLRRERGGEAVRAALEPGGGWES